MIKINLLADGKAPKPKSPSAFKPEVGGGTGRNLLLFLILGLGLAGAGGWWWWLNGKTQDWVERHDAADQELERLKEIRQKGEEYKARKELLARKIQLITELKAKQEVPVHILDQISKNLPDYLWLDRMSANNNEISISGKATSYNAVSTFYGNLTNAGLFSSVTLGRVFEVNEGVSFSLTCAFEMPADAASDSDEEPSQA